MRRYLSRKIITYLVAFFIGVTVDWALPHFMPGDPIQGMLSKYNVANTAGYQALYAQFQASYGLNVSLWQRYLNFWHGVLTVNLGQPGEDFEVVDHFDPQADPERAERTFLAHDAYLVRHR